MPLRADEALHDRRRRVPPRVFDQRPQQLVERRRAQQRFPGKRSAIDGASHGRYLVRTHFGDQLKYLRATYGDKVLYRPAYA